MRLFNRNKDAELPTGYDDPESMFFVPEPLREDYRTAMPSEADILAGLDRAVELRAQRAQADADAAAQTARDNAPGADRDPGTSRLPNMLRHDLGVYRRVKDAGHAEGDAAIGQHLALLDRATEAHRAREAEATAERARQAAKCDTCGRLDVPTTAPTLTLTDPTPSGKVDGPTAALRRRSAVIRLAAGRVCVECEAVVRAEYVAALAAEVTDDGRTRADRAREYVAIHRA